MAATDPREFPERFREKGEATARAQGQAELLDHKSRVVFAELVNRSSASSVAKAENEARCRPEYIEAKEAAIDAQTQANVLRAQLEAMRVSWETWRSMQANKRAEMQIT